MKHEIKGINCEVKNCVHHDMSNCCTADSIKVGCTTAKSTNETNCETFECCNDCNCN